LAVSTAGPIGFTVTETSVAEFTVSGADPLTELNVAVIVTCPVAAAVPLPVLSMVIRPVGVELQVTVELMFFWLPLL
jgi:hypothetical protein